MGFRLVVTPPAQIGLTQGVPETGFLRESVGHNEVFSSKNPVYEVGCVSPDKISVTQPSRRFLYRQDGGVT
ncbi:hypothetical protein [Phormidium nigroviride]